MKHLLLAAALVLLPGSEGSALERRAAHPWAGWVDGSWVRSEITSSAGGQMTTTQKLVSLGEDTYRLGTETTWQGGRTEQTEEHGYGLLGYPHTAPDGTLVGKQTLEIAGQQLECEVWKVRWTEGGATFQANAWVAPDLDHPVRVEQQGGELSFELTVDDLEEWITIDRRKIRCVRYTGWTAYQGRRSAVTQWRSADIPGGHARTVTVVQTPEGKVQQENTVVEFRGERRR